jgi:hypothetical protein
MLVPETTMHKDHLAADRENHVGPTGQVMAMKPISVTQAVNEAPDGKLWLHILTADRTHYAAAVFSRNSVHGLTLG